MSAHSHPAPITVLAIVAGHVESPIAPAPMDRVRLAILYRTLAGRHPRRQYVTTAAQLAVHDPVEFVADSGTDVRRWAGVVVAIGADSVTVEWCRNDEVAWSLAASRAARSRPVYDPWAALDEETATPPASEMTAKEPKTNASRPSYNRRTP